MKPSDSKIFKYAKPDTVHQILLHGTLLFSSPTKFNDPFDVSIQTIAPYDLIGNRTQSFNPLIDIILAKNLPDGNGSKLYQKISLMHSAMKSASEEKRQEVKNMPQNDVWNLAGLVESHDILLTDLKTQIESVGIFCASKTPNNHLLWAHYAEDHTGAVIEFSPNLEKDSMFRLTEEVIYSNERPHLYTSPKDFMEKSLLWKTNDIITDYHKRITLTKSLHWSYEEELRLIMHKPVGVLADEKIGFYNEELKSLYIGCRMSDETANELITMARVRNPLIEIYKMIPDRYEYKLNPVKL